ncbi:aldolase/citrate lyase family protein [Variovorax sp. J22P168]|uniref:HpcH/HpaI aldolase/citrate lyase family protein n=1 Tax=Variovorax jilinensis TaxID=3053513 RepID=UPI002575D22B|nr:aldolase/citrate lyase family protein [Variovorax sp. J22P168]MDM0015341.1 aldolase/citrate lyase family protein [Variovorax sp. J22P168]
MTHPVHPDQALFSGEKAFPVLAACEHFAGSEKLILKALALQDELGPVFDITCDCEDGARAGEEQAHAQMVATRINAPDNRHKKLGVRIHDPSHPAWRQDVEIVVGTAAEHLAYVTIPKATSAAQVAEVIDAVQRVARGAGRTAPVPIHALIETHGALREVQAIAALPHLEVLDFGLMDFVSGHHGAIPASAMRSPGQFEHRLLARAKAEVTAAALAAGVVPAHNVCLNLKDAQVIGSDARRARDEFGFQRMWSIYPAQIVPIIEAMRPDFQEVADGTKILLAAQANDWGPIQYEGELHDRATYRYFWSVLKKADATGMRLPAAARQAFFGAR